MYCFPFTATGGTSHCEILEHVCLIALAVEYNSIQRCDLEVETRKSERAVTRRTGHLYAARASRARAVVYTVLNCRLDRSLLRRFCGAAGYGWDYPDTEYRDIPLCFPEVLCSRPMLMLLTDGNFRLSPAGLVRVRQSLKTLQPIDELKKGPFLLQVTVQGYQQTDAGVEVDVCLSATSRSGCPVWESVLTLLSKDRHHKASRDLLRNSSKCDHCYEEQPANEENLKQVEIRVPRTTGLRCVWSFTDYSPHCLLSLPAMFCSLKSQTAPAFWMLSVCLAEIEKHKGVEIITAPVSITAQFKETQPAPGKITIRFWEISKKLGQSADKDIRFQVQLQGQSTAQMVGLISRAKLM
ncbi:uncharacterized protein si:ch211-12e13.1 [Girardinichthys multiradiatus]|uniref:uncharacterized protein si:ch211-12e13.1 n=1 Tax=Girardinichthys multiradiatus TaxID=208333 RepID=UPI001FAB48C8|nr:uncharacterized protein si:ch211-12e13.1 [Girardinichthys multiradiatus]